MKEHNVKTKPKVVHHVDIGVVEPRWEYSSNPRLEGLFKLLKYVKWENVTAEEMNIKLSNLDIKREEEKKMWPDNDKINNLVMSDIYKKLKHCDISIEQFNEYYNRRDKKEGN